MRDESTAIDLIRVEADNTALQVEYDKLRQEQGEAIQRNWRVQQAVEEVCKSIAEVEMQEGDPLEDKVAQLNQAIQGFSAKITELEACSLLSTPPEEREQRE